MVDERRNTVLSRKYHAIEFNTHARFRGSQIKKKVSHWSPEWCANATRMPQRSQKRTVISPTAAKYIDIFFILRSIYDQIMSIWSCIYAIWYGFVIYYQRMAWFHQYMATYWTQCMGHSMASLWLLTRTGRLGAQGWRTGDTHSKFWHVIYYTQPRNLTRIFRKKVRGIFETRRYIFTLILDQTTLCTSYIFILQLTTHILVNN